MDGPSVDPELGRPWLATLDLRFAPIAGKTRLVRRAHSGPLLVQRPFYPEAGGACHVYLLHPPGGIVGGDRLTIDVTTDPGAEALLTTPAATKFYRSAGSVAHQSVTLRVASGSTLEWLPQETIVFGGALATSLVRADVEPGGQFIGWDVSCLGRPLSNDAFESGFYAPRFEIYQAGAAVHIERARIEAGSALRRARVGLAGATVFGSLVALGSRPELVERLRDYLPPPSDEGVFALTAKSKVIVCRYLGHSVQRARLGFLRVWSELRPSILGREPSAPRIWAT
jgi:urease accessory protein